MRQLRGFYAGNHTLLCPSLKKVNVPSFENLVLLKTESMNSEERHKYGEPGVSLPQPLFTVETIPNLEELTLSCMAPSLTLQGEFPRLLFSKLNSLRFSELEDEYGSVVDFFLQNAPSLEMLAVESSSLKVIFQDKRFVGDHGHFKTNRRLKKLSLMGLPELQHIYEEGCQLEDLETLYVWNCSSLINLVSFSLAFVHLTTLDVSYCNGLINLITSPAARSLITLKTLRITKCSLLEDIVTEKGDGAKDEIEFSSLIVLELVSLPRLNNFCSTKCFIKFPLLSTVVVRQCPRMEIFSVGDTSTPKLHQVQVNYQEWSWEDNINDTIQKMFADKVGFRSLEHLNLSEFPELKDWWYHPQQKIFQNLKFLAVHKCDFLSNVLFTSNLFQGLLNLEELDVKDCNSIEEVFDVESMKDAEMMDKQTTQLKRLTVSGLPKLKHIWSKDLQEIISFKSLCVVQVRNCKMLKNLFSVSLCQDLGQLEIIDIELCGVEEIVAEEEELEECRFDFPKLTSVRLWKLSELRSFYPRKHTLECPSLKDLCVYQCEALQTFGFSRSDFRQQHQVNEVDIPIEQALFSTEKVAFPNLETLELTSINLNKIWDDHQLSASRGIQNLTSLIVKDCGNLKHLFSYCMVESLSQLRQIEISKCPMMEEIIDPEGRDKAVASKEVQFPCLEKIKLNDLENLRTAGHCQFHGVKSMVINNCGKLVCIFPSYMQRKFHNLEILSVKNCGSVKEIFELDANNTSCAEDMKGIHKLTLVGLPKLKHIWSTEPEEIVNFHNLQDLHVESCDNLEYIFPFSVATRLSKLEVLEVLYCGAMKTIVAKKEEMQGTAMFVLNQLASIDLRRMLHLSGFYAGNYTLSCPSLKKIKVFSCENLTLFMTQSMNYQEGHHDAKLGISFRQPLFTVLEVIPNLEKLTMNRKYASMILQDEFPALLLSNLKILWVSGFEDEHDIFPDWFLRNVPSLENLRVKNSPFKEIFQDKIYAGEEGRIQSSTRVKSLSLLTLPKLQHICKEGFQIDPVLEVLEKLCVVSCSSLINLVPSSVGFSCLTSLKIKKCNGLIKLITSTTARSLVKLRTMQIEECNLLEEIVTEKEGEAKDEIAFRSLKILELISLPRLNKFCSSKCFIKFPLLWKVIVRQCPRMEIFSVGDTCNPKLHEVQVNDEEWCWEDNLNGTLQKMFTDMVAFHGFKHLNLTEFPELKDLWYSPSVNNMFQSLKSLVVHKCDLLLDVLFTSNLLQVLQNLEDLEVKDCDSIEAVFGVKGMDDKEMLVKQTELKKLTLSGLPKLKHICNEDPHEFISFRNLRAVKVTDCESLEYLFSFSLCQNLENLEELDVESCGVVEIVSKKEGFEECRFHFPQLTRLRLWHLSKLKRFYPGNHTLECPSLKGLNVYHCEAMQIFDFLCSDFQQLHDVIEVDIPVQQAFFSSEEVCKLERLALNNMDVMTIQNGRHQENLFDKIEVLRLQCFHETLAIFPVDFLQRFPNLICLRVRCSSFYTLFPWKGVGYHIGTSKDVRVQNIDTLVQPESSEVLISSLISFKNMVRLQVSDCKELIFLISSWMAKSLVQLKKLTIRKCEKIEEVVKIDEQEEEEEIIFENLECLELNSSSSFKSFCTGKCTLIFPSLVRLIVKDCPKMKTFSPGVIVTPMLRAVEVENGSKCWNGDLNTTIKQLFINKEIPQLDYDKITEMGRELC